MRTDTHAPDLEDLAAFVDGRLSGERKARVEERLLRDEGYYEVFLETVRYRQDQGQEEDRVAAVVPIARWRRWGLAAPLAAAAVLVIAIGLLRPGPDLAALLDPPAIVAAGEGWSDPDWRRLRSGGGPSPYDGEQLAFRLGARAVDLRVALGGGDREEADRLAAQAERWATDAGLYLLARSYEDLRHRIAGGADDAELQELAAAAETLLAESFERRSPEGRRVALGRWAEAGRLAALSADAHALRRIVRQRPESAAAIEPAIERLESLLERPDPGAAELAAAGAELRRILADLAG